MCRPPLRRGTPLSLLRLNSTAIRGRFRGCVSCLWCLEGPLDAGQDGLQELLSLCQLRTCQELGSHEKNSPIQAYFSLNSTLSMRPSAGILQHIGSLTISWFLAQFGKAFLRQQRAPDTTLRLLMAGWPAPSASHFPASPWMMPHRPHSTEGLSCHLKTSQITTFKVGYVNAPVSRHHY